MHRLRQGSGYSIGLLKPAGSGTVLLIVDCQIVLSAPLDTESTFDSVYIGSDAQTAIAASAFTGSIAEVLLYQKQLTVFNLYRVGHYLKVKYGAACNDWYGAPQVTSFEPYAYGLDTRGEVITMRGSGFGSLPSSIGMSIAGQPACLQAKLPSTAEDTLICDIPEGVGRDLPILLSVASIPALVFDKIGYRPPEVTAVAPSMINFRGGTIIAIVGNFFGPSSSHIAVSIVSHRHSVCKNVVLLTAHTKITCEAPAADAEFTQVHVTVGNQESSEESQSTMLRYSGAQPYHRCALADGLQDCHSCCVLHCMEQRLQPRSVDGRAAHICRQQCCRLCGC